MKKLSLITALLMSVFTATPAMADDHADVKFLNTKQANPRLPFSEAVQVGNILLMSGQLGVDPKTGKLVPGGVTAEADQTLKGIKKTLNKNGYEMKDVVKCLVMLVDMNDFKAFNEVYTQHFKPPYPARSAFAVADLGLNSQVEIECFAAK